MKQTLLPFTRNSGNSTTPDASPNLTGIEHLNHATRGLNAPLLALDAHALSCNASDLVHRSGGLPIRIATKSIRIRRVLEVVLTIPGFQGLLCYSLAEAIWLVECGFTDILVAYPSTDREALRVLASHPTLTREITLMVDDPQHITLINECAQDSAEQIRVCLDIDSSLRLDSKGLLPTVHLGVRRSPIHSVHTATNAARFIAREPKITLVGLMFYDAQIAGLPDNSPAIKLMKRVSVRELRSRRHHIITATRRTTNLEFVNGGGTGSLHTYHDDSDSHLENVTELAAGSGLFGPTLFDGYQSFSPTPALAYALPVIRRPTSKIRTVFSGGYIASGPTGTSRVPTPTLPRGMHLLKNEGAGEVQTPVAGTAANSLRIGDRTWWRHAKSGEVCERFNNVAIVSADSTIDITPTYRGEGKCFG